MLDTAEMLLRRVATAKPEVDPTKMCPMKIVSYSSVDGLTIPAYLTLPKNVTGSMPTVVLIHAGPTERERQGMGNGAWVCRTTFWRAPGG